MEVALNFKSDNSLMEPSIDSIEGAEAYGAINVAAVGANNQMMETGQFAANTL